MPIVLDTGSFSGNSFVTVIDADMFNEDRGNSLWTAEEDELKKEAALIRAFDYLAVLDFSDTAFDNGVPTAIEKAQCIGALKELETPGVLQQDREVGVKKDAIDGAIEKQFFESGQRTLFTAIDNLVKSYLRSATISSRKVLVRG